MVTKKKANKSTPKSTKKSIGKAKVPLKTQAKHKASAPTKAAAKPAKVAKPEIKAKAAATKQPVRPAVAKSVQKPIAATQHQAKVATKPVPSKAAPATGAAPKAPAAKPAAPATPPASKSPVFKVGELVVYPAHGVGKVTNVEVQEIAGTKLELYIVDFEKEKLRLKVPTNRAEQKGMRHLADRAMIEQAMKVIRGRARIKRVMWSRRAQEYDAKINSGDLIAVAEVVRDLYRSERQPEQSYSERQLFEQALARFARELAAVRKIDDDQCIKELEDFLARNAKRAATDKSSDEETADEAA